MTQDIIEEVFRNHLMHQQDLLSGYIIIIDGKVFCDSLGKFIYPTRNAAVKGFYNQMKWRAHTYAYYHTPIHLREDRAGYRPFYRGVISEDDYNILRDFKRFKRELINHHNFQVIRLR